MTLRVVCLLPVVGQPRFAKRVAMMQSQGAEVRCLAFDRPYHKGRQPSCPVDTLGSVPHGRYVARFGVFFRSIVKIRKSIRHADVTYCFGLDMLLLCWVSALFTSSKLVLELGDLRYIQTADGLKSTLFRFFDRWLVKKASYVVFTARGYYENYYYDWLRVRLDCMIIENKLDIESAPTNLQLSESSGSPIVIGYFGLLRCDWSIRTLIDLADHHRGSLEVLIAGYWMLPHDLKKEVQSRPNITLLGEYRSPQDLPDLYGRADLVWACYAPIKTDDLKYKWARTNRFYEACAYRKPLIVRQGSGDSETVASHSIGLVTDALNGEDMVKEFQLLKRHDISTWENNMNKLPASVFLYTDEASTLYSALSRIA